MSSCSSSQMSQYLYYYSTTRSVVAGLALRLCGSAASTSALAAQERQWAGRDRARRWRRARQTPRRDPTSHRSHTTRIPAPGHNFLPYLLFFWLASSAPLVSFHVITALRVRVPCQHLGSSSRCVGSWPHGRGCAVHWCLGGLSILSLIFGVRHQDWFSWMLV